MSWRSIIDSLLGRTPDPPADEDRVMLDATEERLADRLSKLKGVSRDDVMEEAYRRSRRARLLEEVESYRRAPR